MISKDTDFYYWHLLQQKPSKLLLVCNREHEHPGFEALV